MVVRMYYYDDYFLQEKKVVKDQMNPAYILNDSKRHI